MKRICKDEDLQKVIRAIDKTIKYDKLEFVKFDEFDLYHFIAYDNDGEMQILASRLESFKQTHLTIIRK